MVNSASSSLCNRLFLASWSRRTGSVAGLETLYNTDRIILFFQLVLRCQCYSRVCVNMLQDTGFLSKQTAWQNFGGAIYCAKKHTKKMASALFGHYLGLEQKTGIFRKWSN